MPENVVPEAAPPEDGRIGKRVYSDAVFQPVAPEHMPMRSLWIAAFLLCLSVQPARAVYRHPEHGRQEDRKRAADGVTEGWVVTYDSPDPARSWERIPRTLVVARRGTVIRRWMIHTVRKWIFWNGGREVAVEWGGLHFATRCYLASVKTGRQTASYPGNCGEAGESAPAWVKALEGW